MAVYKVPQDVEADDKLIGPFSFRQFIYLIIVAIAIAIAWGLSRLFIGLAIIPLPIILFFGALALPLRKDQPMEIYLAAVVSFYIKPRKRLWQADGIQSLVEITAPKVVEVQRMKNLSQSEAERRLSYLADIVDTGGWAIRGVATTQSTSPMQNEVFFEAQSAEDILAVDGGVARSFDTMINQSDLRRRQEILDRMHQNENTNGPPLPSAQFTAPSLADPYSTFGAPTQPPSLPTDVSVFSDPNVGLTPPPVTPTQPFATPTPQPQVSFNPYPNAMHQSVVAPLSAQPASTPQQYTQPTPQQQQQYQSPTAAPPPPPPVMEPEPITTSGNVVSPDIINLANNADLSIETIAHEANRIRQQEADENEVVISLR
ncbi:MAG: uncharacterized protein JWM07_820 [Candidatus Saccharibacteria bacterium]|nr:uncharacterized protein [Candidatus Saccharibacteria bacterium]